MFDGIIENLQRVTNKAEDQIEFEQFLESTQDITMKEMKIN